MFGIKDQLGVMLMIIFLGSVLIVLWSVFILPFFLEGSMIYIPILQYLFSFLVFLNYILCFLTEPGIIPRNYYLYNTDLIDKKGCYSQTSFSSGKVNDDNMQEIRNNSLVDDREKGLENNNATKPRIFT